MVDLGARSAPTNVPVGRELANDVLEPSSASTKRRLLRDDIVGDQKSPP